MARIKDLRPITPRTNGTRKESAIKKIARHHSATTSGNWAAFWDHWNKTLGWGTGGYHEIILRDGTVELCYDPKEITNGVGGQNSYVYNICVVGNGSFTDAQEKTFDERCKIAMARLNLKASDVLGHNEFPKQATSCPGINMVSVRKRLSTGGDVGQASKPKPTPSPPKPNVSKPSTNKTTSIVDYLNSKGINSSADNRKKLAVEYGVKNYDLTAAKNTELLNKMRAGKSVSKPAAKPKPVAKKNTVTLPKSAKTWRTYKTNVQPVKANSDWSLTPSAFGGIAYEILGRPYANVVTVNTSRGKRNIFVGPGTGAVIN